MLIRFTQALTEIGLGRSKGYALAGDLVPTPLMVGSKAMLPQAEADALRLAITAGFDDNERRELVHKLHAARAALATDAEVRAILEAMQKERRARGAESQDVVLMARRSAAAKKLVARRGGKPALEETGA
ncbi:MAG: hypothetical protein K8R60_04485 [Burkholderiales bacterium]|nr:hypothetical protein [Burkholderiales bacterium]